MLATDYREELKRRLAETACLVAIPRAMQHLFQSEGSRPPKPHERRRFVRFHAPQRTLIETDKTFRAVERESCFHTALVIDVSRSGASFLHSAEIFPGERLAVWFPTGKLTCVVARCLRHNARCFEVGVAFQDGPQTSGWLRRVGCRLAARKEKSR